MSLPGEIIAVSSAYEAVVVFVEFGISAVYMLNKSGERSLEALQLEYDSKRIRNLTVVQQKFGFQDRI
jgi:predicted O-methyltransferase YrrM